MVLRASRGASLADDKSLMSKGDKLAYQKKASISEDSTRVRAGPRPPLSHNSHFFQAWVPHPLGALLTLRRWFDPMGDTEAGGLLVCGGAVGHLPALRAAATLTDSECELPFAR